MNFVYVDVVVVNFYDEFLIIIGSVGVVGGGKIYGVGFVFLEEWVFIEIGGIIIGSEDDGVVDGEGLVFVFSFDIVDDVVFFDEVNNVGFFGDFDMVGFGFGEFFEFLY